MSVTSLKHLPKLEMVLFDRPAGRNVFAFAANEIVRLRKRNVILEAMLIRAVGGHDGPTWDGPGDPADCTQCNYDGMKEVLAEGRRIIKQRSAK